jgi:hypothetical protein
MITHHLHIRITAASLLLLATTAVAEGQGRIIKQRPPPPTVTDGNPLVALASALVSVVLYVLQFVQHVITLATITIPT